MGREKKVLVRATDHTQNRTAALMIAICPNSVVFTASLKPLCSMQYEAKLFKLLDTYNKAFLFCADNVGSKQFMDIRAVRDSAYSGRTRALQHLSATAQPFACPCAHYQEYTELKLLHTVQKELF